MLNWKKLKDQKRITFFFTSLHFTTSRYAPSRAGGRRSVARSDESGLSTARARLGVARAKLGACKTRPVRQCFSFWARNEKVGEKRFFSLFFIFFSCKKQLSRPLFSRILEFFSPTFWFLAHFSDFFLGQKIRFLGNNPENFLVLKFSFLGHFLHT